MKTNQLAANPDNPRTITDAKLKQLAKALEEFGDLGGFVYNRKSKQLVGGHQRAKLFGAAEIVIEQNYKKPTRTGTVAEGYAMLKGGRFKYREVYWDSLKEKAANIAANKGAGEWDMPKLGEWFTELKELGLDLDLTMFDEAERKDFFSITGEIGLTDPDAVPDNAPTRCNAGDLWVLGNHRLLCGDSTNVQHVERLMGGEKRIMVFTDPPYGMNLNADYSGMVNRDGVAGRKHKNIAGDNQDFDPGTIFGVFADCPEILLFGADYYAERIPERNAGSWLVWDKRVEEKYDKVIGSGFEMIWSKRKRKRDIIRFEYASWGARMADKVNGAKPHPTMKPVGLLLKILEMVEGEKVADLFLGSGSTLIACEKTGRRCFGMEIDPKYCDVILKRWEDFTGKKAVLQKVAAKQRSNNGR